MSAAADELSRTDPGIDLAVEVAEPGPCQALLLAGDVEVAVVDEYDYVPLALPDSSWRANCARTARPVTSRAAGAMRRSRRSPTSPTERWVMPPDDAACGLAVRSACRAAGFEPAVRWTSDDMLLLVRAVAAGHGVAVLPRLPVAADAAPVGYGRAQPAAASADRGGACVRLARPRCAAVVGAIARWQRGSRCVHAAWATKFRICAPTSPQRLF